MFEKNLEIGYLLDVYGDILPERRRDMLDLYYNDDLSLAEIAEQMGITRQGVRECIKKAEVIAYEDLGAEAIRRLEVEDFPVIVIIDSEGNNLYETGRAAYLETLK